MCKKILGILFVIFVFSIVSVQAYALDISYSDEESSLEKLAAQRLFIYGIIDEVPESFDRQMTRVEAVEIIYKTLKDVCGDEVINRFSDVSEEYRKYTDYFYNRGVINGYTDGLFHPNDLITQKHFLYILLRAYDETVSFDNLDYKLRELGIQQVDNFDVGDIYIFISKFIDIKNLEYQAIHAEIQLPNTISIDVYSVEDGLNKIRESFLFGPEKIKINYFCSENEVVELFTILLNEQSSTAYDYGDTFLFSKYFDSAFDMKFTYAYPLNEEKREEVSKVLNEIWFQYSGNEIDIGEYLYLRAFKRFVVGGSRSEAIIERMYLEPSIFVNLNATNWIDCLGEELEEKTIQILSDIEEYRNLSDIEKALKINEYIIVNAEYDYDEYYQVINDDGYEGRDIPHGIIGFITTGKIVCDGYASTFHWLMNYLDVTTVCQNGKVDGMAHEWNKVLIDGKWYNVDVCWNDTGRNKYFYFLKSDKYFKRTHQVRYNYLHKTFNADTDWYRSMEL